MWSRVPGYTRRGDCDEAYDLRSLRGVYLWRSERADTCVAAFAWTYPSADMARGRARCAARYGAGVRYHVGEGGVDRRQAGCGGEQRLAAHDDGVFADGKEHGSSGRRVSGRRLSDSGDGSGRHGGLRLADTERDHLCAAEIPRTGQRTLSEIGTVPEIGAFSGIADGARGRAENGGAGAVFRCV